jgi:hypothetical protein
MNQVEGAWRSETALSRDDRKMRPSGGANGEQKTTVEARWLGENQLS